MGIELELKYSADAQALQAIDAAFPQQGITLQMETVYYDTEDGTLSALHYTLRRRTENGRSICTLKTPAGQGRNEWETECDDIHRAIPELCKLGGPEELIALTGSGVRAVCGARFTRIAKTIAADGGVIELALDKGVLTGSGREAPFYEVEAELKSGSCQTLLAFGKALAEKFMLTPELKSKFARALRLAKGD